MTPPRPLSGRGHGVLDEAYGYACAGAHVLDADTLGGEARDPGNMAPERSLESDSECFFLFSRDLVAPSQVRWLE